MFKNLWKLCLAFKVTSMCYTLRLNFVVAYRSASQTVCRERLPEVPQNFLKFFQITYLHYSINDRHAGKHWTHKYPLINEKNLISQKNHSFRGERPFFCKRFDAHALH